jgi:hypothetical protein
VLRHIDAFVCLPHCDRFPRHCLRTLLQAHAALSTPATRPFPSAGACPTLDLAANWRSNPIAHRVRRKRQRLPPSLLIENASDRLFCPSSTVLPEAFPIKASDYPGVRTGLGPKARFIGRRDRASPAPHLARISATPALDLPKNSVFDAQDQAAERLPLSGTLERGGLCARSNDVRFLVCPPQCWEAA